MSVLFSNWPTWPVFVGFRYLSKKPQCTSTYSIPSKSSFSLHSCPPILSTTTTQRVSGTIKIGENPPAIPDTHTKIDMTRIANSLVRREIPKIFGSSTAFIVLVVVLVTIIIVSLSAVIYLLRRERRIEDQEAQRRRRYKAQPLVDRDLSNPRHSKKWYSYLWGSRDRHNHVPLDKSTTIMMGRTEEDLIQANSREWDVDDSAAMQSSDTQSGLLRTSEKEPSSSIVGPRFYTHRMHSATSDDVSSVHYDPHDVRGLPYPEQFPILPQATIPSTLSSPTSPPPSSPVPRQIMKSPEPISNTPSLNSVRDSLPQFAPPALGSGTKFFESF